MNICKLLAAAGALCLSFHAHAAVKSFNFSGLVNEPGKNWAKGVQWHLRAILIDPATMQPIGNLSHETIIDMTTIGTAETPQNVSVTLDAPASVGTIIRIYRKTTAFEAGDDAAYADFDVCPCAAGKIKLTATGDLPNGNFPNDQPALPVTLRDFSVD